MCVEAYADLAAQVLHRPARLRTAGTGAGADGIRLVAVDGPSGAGKTVFAARLAAALRRHHRVAAPVVHTDDLLDGWTDQFTFWPRLESWVLSALRRGQPARFRGYDWHAGGFTSPPVCVRPGPVVLLEGVSAARAAIRPELTLSVFVTAPTDRCLDRVLARDGAVVRRFLQAWQQGERRHFAADATARHADVVVDGAPTVRHDPATHYVRLAGRGWPAARGDGGGWAELGRPGHTIAE